MFAGLVWLTNNHMFGSGYFWDKSPSWFLKIPRFIRTISKFNRMHSGNLFRIALPNMWLLVLIKGPLSGLRKFLATESSLKITKNAFYFTLKALFVLKIFKFLSWLFGHVEKRLDYKAKVNFKIYDIIIIWETNNYNINIIQYLKK